MLALAPVTVVETDLLVDGDYVFETSGRDDDEDEEDDEEDCFMIKLDKIITMTETKDDKLIHFYNKFLEDSIAENSVHIPTSGEIKPDAKMGYISSVDKSRKKLEDVFKLEIESKES